MAPSWEWPDTGDSRGKFDAIVAFAEVEQFIDTPVKHYSSGMYLRLGFAVAAHLEPDILIVDEVLAVGDAQFQKKCLNKMQEVGQQGRTVLFVSHNMPAITRICPRTILLEGGTIVADGRSNEVIGKYMHSEQGTTAARNWTDPLKRPGKDVARLLAVSVHTKDGEITESVNITDSVGITMEYELTVSDKVIIISYRVTNEEGIHLFVCRRCRSNVERPSPSCGEIPDDCMDTWELLDGRETFCVGSPRRAETHHPPIL